MSTDYLATSTTLSDHDLTLAIPGDADGVRRRLIEAVQRLGYKVLGEQALTAKRSGQGSARWNGSLNVLDYPTTLAISLKQINDSAVLATFNYEIRSCVHLTSGDRQTLVREAEALAALATERLTISTCPACGTKVTDESRFCRVCGAPLVLDLPELEVLRLTRETRASSHNMFVGAVALLLAALTTLPIFVVNGARIFGPLMWVGIPFATYGLFVLLQGIWQLHRTLNPKIPNHAKTRSQPAFTASRSTALPPARVDASVTEGTTELLFSNNDRREGELIRRKDNDTAEIDNDRLM